MGHTLRFETVVAEAESVGAGAMCVRWGMVFALCLIALTSCVSGSENIEPTIVSQRPTDPAFPQTAEVASTRVVLTPVVTRTPTGNSSVTAVVTVDTQPNTPAAETRGAAQSESALLVTTRTIVECDSTPDENGFLQWEQMIEASECVAGYFVWPMDRQLDFNWVLNRDPTNRPEAVPEGFQYTIAWGANWCAWFGAWLDARAAGDSASEATALEVLVNVLPNYQTSVPGFPPDLLDPGLVNGQNETIQRAQLGDPGPMQQAYDVNCTAIQWQ